MKYLIFDTETTGLHSQDEVIQFSGLILDNNLKLKRGYNWYCDTQHEINKDAAAVHGITKKMLHNLSGGKVFEDHWFTMLNGIDMTEGITFIGWNVDFDKRLINQTLNNNGLDEFDFGRKVTTLRNSPDVYSFDLMKAVANLMVGRDRLKLEQASKMISMDEATLKKRYSRLASKFTNVAEKDFHNALYDTYVTYEIFSEFAMKFMY